jgi:hypothetical protein
MPAKMSAEASSVALFFLRDLERYKCVYKTAHYCTKVVQLIQSVT